MDAIGMREQILNFPRQLAADLPVVNAENLPPADKFILCGLGGSALGGGLLKTYRPELDLLIHRDYGLPRVPKYFLEGSLLILSSYSGETEEVLDTLRCASARGLKLSVLAAGGLLLEEAKKLRLPYVILPAGLPPRLAVGYSFVGLGRLVGDEKLRSDLAAASVIAPAVLEPQGESLAGSLAGKLPVVYSSTVNLALAYNWKIRLNETAKTAAFFNVLPEMNHNELAAADPHFSYIFLRDSADDLRIQNRFSRLAELFRSRGLTVAEVELEDAAPLAKIFYSVILADWTSYHLALLTHRDPVGVPAIEDFKKLIKAPI
ncbi:MAG: hypothetical protein HYT46_00740 [Candidatus Vogelbacteria bacterium]|nr:hypothetical protein [Candidatus Vogelbacteria bacterium]